MAPKLRESELNQNLRQLQGLSPDEALEEFAKLGSRTRHHKVPHVIAGKPGRKGHRERKIQLSVGDLDELPKTEKLADKTT